MPGSWRRESSDVVCRSVSCGSGGWRNKRFTCSTWSRAIWWDNPTGKEAEISIFQLLRILSILWSSYCRHFRGLDWRQQRLAMGFWDFHCNNSALHPNISPWLSLLQEQNSHWKSDYHHLQGKIQKTYQSSTVICKVGVMEIEQRLNNPLSFRSYRF